MVILKPNAFPSSFVMLIYWASLYASPSTASHATLIWFLYLFGTLSRQEQSHTLSLLQAKVADF